MSAGLVLIDYERDTVRLVHFSVQQYFEKTSQRWFPNAILEIAKTCAAYLAFDNFGYGPCIDPEDLEQRFTKFGFLSYAAHDWGTHVRESPQDDLEKLALNFLDNL